MDIRALLKGTVNPQEQINQGEQIPTPQPGEDFRAVGTPAEEQDKMSKTLMGMGLIPGMGPIASAAAFAGGVMMDPNKTAREKLSPGNIAMGAIPFMGSVGKMGQIAEEVAPIRQAIKSIPTAVERQLEKHPEAAASLMKYSQGMMESLEPEAAAHFQKLLGLLTPVRDSLKTL